METVNLHDPELTRRDGLEVLAWPLFSEEPVEVVVTTRHGGVSTGPYATLNLGLHVGDEPEAVVENRRRAARTIGLELDDLVFCAQTHGSGVATVDAADRGRGTRDEADAIADVDALVTSTPDVGLVVMVADCVPIVLFDPGTRTLACVHAGWRGTVAGVARATVDTMVRAGTDPSDLLVAIGPAIDRSRYQVGDEVAQALRRVLGDDADDVVRPAAADMVQSDTDEAQPDGGGRWRVDLGEANRRMLLADGLDEGRIALAAAPTGSPGPFFSHREAAPCGRFAVLARLLA